MNCVGDNKPQHSKDQLPPNVELDQMPMEEEDIDLSDEDGCSYLPPQQEIPKGALEHHVIGAFSLSCSAPSSVQHLLTTVTYCGEHAGYKFVENLLRFRNTIRTIYKNEFNKPLPTLTKHEKELYKVDRCHICKREITCELSHQEWIDTKASKAFTDDEKHTGGKLICSELDLLGPKVRQENNFLSKIGGVII